MTRADNELNWWNETLVPVTGSSLIIVISDDKESTGRERTSIHPSIHPSNPRLLVMISSWTMVTVELWDLFPPRKHFIHKCLFYLLFWQPQEKWSGGWTLSVQSYKYSRRFYGSCIDLTWIDRSVVASGSIESTFPNNDDDDDKASTLEWSFVSVLRWPVWGLERMSVCHLLPQRRRRRLTTHNWKSDWTRSILIVMAAAAAASIDRSLEPQFPIHSLPANAEV